MTPPLFLGKGEDPEHFALLVGQASAANDLWLVADRLKAVADSGDLIERVERVAAYLEPAARNVAPVSAGNREPADAALSPSPRQVEGQVPGRTSEDALPDPSSQLLKYREEVERLRAAGEALSNFAWSAVTADCEESRAYLQSLIGDLRSALTPSAGGVEP